MTVKNCAKCGTTNPIRSTECMACASPAFLDLHQAVGDVDGKARLETDTKVLAAKVEVLEAKLGV